MIEIERVRVAFFDFDDTLCIHSVHKDMGSELRTSNTYEIFDKFGCRVNKQMANFIDQLKEMGVEMHLVSATSDKNVVALKLEWVLRKYGVSMINSCVEDHNYKVSRIKEHCDSRGLNYDETLFVDDMYQNLCSVAAIGVQTCSPMEIVNYMNDSE